MIHQRKFIYNTANVVKVHFIDPNRAHIDIVLLNSHALNTNSKFFFITLY